MPADLDPATRAGIGASQVAKVFGISPFGGALDLYCQLIGLADKPETEPQRRGRRAEPELLLRYADEHQLWPELMEQDTRTRSVGRWLVDVGTQRHPEHDWLIASPDAVEVHDGLPVALIEAKTDRNAWGWEDPEEIPDGVPLHYLLQVQHQLLVGLRWGKKHVWPPQAKLVARVRYVDDYREYTIQPNGPIQRAIIEKTGDFWHSHVQPRIPPAWDGSEAGNRLVSSMYPQPRTDEKLVVPRGDTIDLMMAELARRKADLANAETLHDTLVQQLKERLEAVPAAAGEDWSVSYRRSKDRTKIDWKAVAEELGAQLGAGAMFQAQGRHTTRGPGTRSLRTYWRKR
jgi:predicted phage-related endonuclease